jgi:hypothetical protein
MESLEFLAIVLGILACVAWIIAGVMFWRRRWSVAFVAVFTAIVLGTIGTMIVDRM